MTPLAIIVAEPDGARTRTALTLAAGAAALGRPVSMLFDGGSVAALTTGGALLEAAIGLGVRITACQTGLADAAIDARDLPPGVVTGGMVGFLAQAGDAQLVLA